MNLTISRICEGLTASISDIHIVKLSTILNLFSDAMKKIS